MEDQTLLPMSVVPWVQARDFDDQLARRASSLTAIQRAAAEGLHRDGYAVLEGVVPAALCDTVRRELEPLFDEEYALSERRVPDAWRRGAEGVRTLATLPVIQETLDALYGRRPIPFQTLNFKWGTEQGFHSDAVHFTSVPDGFLCGVWVALEDVDAGNGPLAYYPGSHEVPQFGTFEPGRSPDRYTRFETVQRDLMERLGAAPVEFHARKGDALVWAAHLLHGGRPITREGSTRWSQVTHYYFEDCIYFQPIYSDAMSGAIKLMNVTDLNTLEPVEQRYGGAPVRCQDLGGGWSTISIECGGDGHDGVGTLEAQVAALSAKRDALAASRSYRLGHAILTPMRWVKDRRARVRPTPR
jgi:hypothetical protein